MFAELNAMDNETLKRGWNIYIATLNVPDLWVYRVEESSVTYTYSNDDAFVEQLKEEAVVQVGFYKLAALETSKVDLSEYVKLSVYEAKIAEIEKSVSELNTNYSKINSDLTTVNEGACKATHDSITGGLNYYVKNGICYLTGEFTINENLSGAVNIFSNLPIPKTTFFFSCGGHCGIATTFAVGIDGNLLLYYPAIGVSTTQRYDMTLSYLVK